MTQPPPNPSIAGPNRRHFLATASAGAALAASAAPVHAAGDDTIKVGLVGCGGRGSGAAVNAMRADAGVRITALADLFEDSMTRCRENLSRQFPEQFTAQPDACFAGFEGYKQLKQSAVDVVLLASPPYYRPAHLEAAVDAGKEIFCEKPVATDSVGVHRVEEACRRAAEKKLNVVSGLCWRYDQGMVETVKRIHDGAIGDIVSTQANYLTSPVWIKAKRPDESEMHYQCRNWYYYTWLSGDHIVEQFIHSLDKAMWLRHDEPPVSAVGLGGRQQRSDLTQGNIYDHFAVIYRWADGSTTHAYTRQMKGCKNETEDYVRGASGHAKLIAHQIESSASDGWKFRGDEVQMHQAEQNEFFRALRGKRDRIDNSEYMCRSTLMAILGREACYTGKELTYEEVANSGMDLGPKTLAMDATAPEVVVPQPGRYSLS